MKNTVDEQIFCLMAQAEDLQKHAIKLQLIASETLKELTVQIAALQDLIWALHKKNDTLPGTTAASRIEKKGMER